MSAEYQHLRIKSTHVRVTLTTLECARAKSAAHRERKRYESSSRQRAWSKTRIHAFLRANSQGGGGTDSCSCLCSQPVHQVPRIRLPLQCRGPISGGRRERWRGAHSRRKARVLRPPGSSIWFARGEIAHQGTALHSIAR